jgi:hypothetical protein
VKKILVLVFIFSVGGAAFAQDSTRTSSPYVKSKSEKKSEKRERINAISRQEEEGNLSFHKQSAFGLELRTNGYGLFYELGIRRTPRFSNLFALELTEIKHPKETKLGAAENFFSNSYVFGKQNNFYQAKLSVGQQYILGQKGNKNGIAVTAGFNAGVAIGFLKPYILQVRDNNKDRTISYEEDSTLFLDQSVIVGGAGFTKGWDDLKIKPGVFLRGALRFDFGRYNEKLQALEIGVSVEGYAQQIPIMVYNDPKRLFYQGHVAFVFGGRK